MMQFDRITIGREAKNLGYARDTFEKMLRLTDVLVPVLHSGVFFSAEEAQKLCIPYLEQLLTFTPSECLFLLAFKEKQYCPSLQGFGYTCSYC